MMQRTVMILLLLVGAATAQRRQEVSFRRTELAPGLHLLSSGAGGNVIACIGEDGVLLVDTEYAQLAERLKRAVEALTDRPVRFAINTHWHFDHVGGNAALARAGAWLVAHENVRKRMSVDQRIAVIDRQVPAAPREALPAVTYRECMTLHVNGQEVVLAHYPAAHTDGDTVVYFAAANVVHAGDIFFNGGYPFIDVSAGGGIDGVIAAGEAIVARTDDETRIVPGHGPLARRADLIRYLGMLRAFRAAVAKEVEAGKDLAAILAARPTAELDRTWGRTFFPPERFTEIVFRSLQRARRE
jgi:cyclase